MGDFFGYIAFLVLIKSLQTPELRSSGGASCIRATATTTRSPLTLKTWVCSEKATHLIKHVRLTQFSFEVSRAS